MQYIVYKTTNTIKLIKNGQVIDTIFVQDFFIDSVERHVNWKGKVGSFFKSRSNLLFFTRTIVKGERHFYLTIFVDFENVQEIEKFHFCKKFAKKDHPYFLFFSLYVSDISRK